MVFFSRLLVKWKKSDGRLMIFVTCSTCMIRGLMSFFHVEFCNVEVFMTVFAERNCQSATRILFD